MSTTQPSIAAQTHAGFARTFVPGRLTIGFIAPARGYPDSPLPDLRTQSAIVRKLDEIDAAALWLRDVPFYDPSFGDLGQVLDPLVYAGWLAALTTRIAVGTAGLVTPLKEPVSIAKQFASADYLLGGRFLGGLASGDRPTEYPAFGIPHEERTSRYREMASMLRILMSQSYPNYQSKHYGNLRGDLDLIPKPPFTNLPLLAIGRAGQSLDWIAENLDGWIWHGVDAKRMVDIVPKWREHTACFGFKPYGYGTFFDLDTNPDAPLQTGRILRGGRHALLDLLATQREAGVNHVALNLKPTRRDALDLLDEMAKYIIPEFSA